ncbi:sugar phosphate isomerase/epimerase [Niabella insulamsoli]|uniref:sugar phosphate isomerase/epimerase family protein n=1 Tax=Niabella insulamsoli TaxID=3144874 RepID=UPI0031FD81DB
MSSNEKACSRRSFLTSAALASAGLIFTNTNDWANAFNQKKPNSKFAGVQIGAITYSFRSMPEKNIADILKYIVASGVSAVELMGDAVEAYAGKPQKADKAAVAAWRAHVSMDKFKEVRKMFDKAGVSIYAFKQPDALAMNSTDAEIDYLMRAAKVLGAKSVTLELPKKAEHTARLGSFGTKHKMFVGYHTHLQATDQVWDVALSQSPYNSINLDCGHYIAAGGANTRASLLALIEAKHDRITSFHMKDRKSKQNGGDNLPWGAGDTPIKEILLLLKQKKYDIPVSVELEYKVPEGSDAVKEVKKCVGFAKNILLPG